MGKQEKSSEISVEKYNICYDRSETYVILIHIN